MLRSPRVTSSRSTSSCFGDWPLPVDPDGDKYSRGVVLVVGGSVSTPGAVILAGMAALRMGAGKLQIATEPSIAGAVAIAVPESKVISLDDAADHPSGQDSEIRNAMAQADCVLIGPGMERADATTGLVVNALESVADSAVLVLDAAAIPSLRTIEPTLRKRVTGRLVLTPNRQELEDLLQDRADTDETGDDHTTAAASDAGRRRVRRSCRLFWQRVRGYPVEAGRCVRGIQRWVPPAPAMCAVGSSLERRHAQATLLKRHAGARSSTRWRDNDSDSATANSASLPASSSARSDRSFPARRDPRRRGTPCERSTCAAY